MSWRLFGGLLLGAAALRFVTLAHQSYWLDEGYTVSLLHNGLHAMVDRLRHIESTPPLYDVVAWGWARVFGFGPFALRSLSALAGTLTVGVVYLIGLRVGGRRAAFIAGAIVAVDPLPIWFSQEARAYALAVLLTAVSLWCALGAAQDGDRRWWAGWAVASMLALATHYFTAFMVAPEIAWLVAREWRAGRPQRAWWAVPIVATGAALLPLALDQRSTGHTRFISSQPLGHRIEQVPKQLLVGYATPGQVATAAIAVGLVIAGGYGLWRDRDRARRARALLVLAIAAAAILIPLGLAVIGLDYLDTRNLLPALPALAVVGGAGLAALQPVAVGAFASSALVGVLLVVTLLGATQSRYERDDWAGIAAALGPPRAPRVIVISPASGWIPLRAYNPALRPLPAAGATVGEVDVVAPIGRGADGDGSLPPRPTTALLPPTGFEAAGVRTTPSYTVVRYRTPPGAPPVTIVKADLPYSQLAPSATWFTDGG